MSRPTADVSLRPAVSSDVGTLSGMNQRLIEDERSPNPMSLDQLRDRMARWLAEEYEAFLVCIGAQEVGYGLYRPETHESGRDEVYLRQFYIERSCRRRGVGRAAIELFVLRCLAEDKRVTLDVLEANPHGRAFWDAVGFEAVYTRMRRER